MAGIDEFLGGIGLSGGVFTGVLGMITWIVIGLISLSIAGVIIYYFYNRKQWNLKITFRIPRGVITADGNDVNLYKGTIFTEFGKGGFNSKKGVVFLKRKGKRKVSMKPFELDKFLNGSNELEVIQVGAEEYIPVIPQSYFITTDEKGNQTALLKFKADRSESKSWRNTFEREAKQAFAISNLLKEYAPFIMIGLVIFLWGIQTLILYNRMKG